MNERSPVWTGLPASVESAFAARVPAIPPRFAPGSGGAARPSRATLATEARARDRVAAGAQRPAALASAARLTATAQGIPRARSSSLPKA